MRTASILLLSALPLAAAIPATLDLQNLYAFQSPADSANAVFILTVGPALGNASAAFDTSGEYTFAIDTNGDAAPDTTYTFNFSAPAFGGLQTITLKKDDVAIATGSTTRTGQINGGADGSFTAGTFDDPHFFDRAGYEAGFSFTGTDFQAGKNVNAIILEVPSATLGTSNIGVFARTRQDGRNIDRIGRPEIAEFLIEPANREAFGKAEPADDAATYSAEVSARLISFGASSGTASALTGILLPDILTIDTSNAAGYLNGRRLADDVIDASLNLYSNGAITTDLVDANDQPFPSTFPYLPGGPVVTGFPIPSQTDSFGYRASITSGNDSDFVSIRAFGSGLDPIGGLDDGYAEITLPVPFVFYGESYTTVRMSTNGYLALANPQTDPGNQFNNPAAIPSTHNGGALIHAFHDDLVIGSSDNSLFHKYEPLGISGNGFRPNVGVSIFQWVGAKYISAEEFVTFQALLFDDGSIQINFPDRFNSAPTFTTSIGIQNEAGTIGLDFHSETSIPTHAPSRISYNILPPQVLITSKALVGPGTLFDSISTAPNPAHIEFSPEIFTGGPANTLPLFETESGNTRFLNNFQPGQVLTINAAPVGGITLAATGSGLDNSTIVQNGTSSRLHLQALTLTGSNNVTTANTAGFGGAITNFNGGSVTILDSTIYANSANTGGGGISNSGNGSYLRLTNSTVTENQAQFGGGIFTNDGATTILSHTTVANNNGAGGIFCSSAITLDSCLISNPTATSPRDLNGNAGAILALQRSNLIRTNNGPFAAQLTPGTLIGTDTTPLEPLLVGDGKSGSGLADNGGPTPTLIPQPGSPAIDRGGSTAIDQRGRPRIGLPDLGATEADWGDTLGSTDFIGTATYDFIRASELLTATPASFAAGDISLLTDNNTGTGTDSGGLNWNLTLTTPLRARPLTARGIRIQDDITNPDLVTLYGSNDGIHFTNLGSADLDTIPGATGQKTFYLRSSGTSSPGLLETPYHQFRLQLSSSRPGFGGASLQEVEILVSAPAEPGIYAIRKPAAGNFYFLDVDVVPGATYDIFTSADLATPFDFSNSFTSTTNPGVFGATLIVAPVTPTRGFYKVLPR